MDFIIGIATVIVVVVAYMLPSVIAFSREDPNRWPIFVLNALVGWTLIAWACILAYAVRSITSRP